MKKNLKMIKTGNEAVAEALRQVNPDVVAAYPITPATEIVQKFSSFVSDGKVKTEFVAVESEHSAISATMGASAAGARAMTCTSSQGLALMHEALYVVSGLRLPVAMAVVNRALSAPINIHCDHSDTMGARDSGWMQMYAENAQEAYDNFIQMVKICEKALLPGMTNMDGFITSHCAEGVEILPDKKVKEFVGEYKPERYLLDTDNPYTLGALDLQDFYFEHKRQQIDAMEKSLSVIIEVGREFGEKFGRSYGLLDEYMVKDADVVVVGMGSFCGTAKQAVSNLRRKGIKAGLLKVRVFRPFPHEELIENLADVKKVIVMDRADSASGLGGPLFNEIKSVLFGSKKKIYGCVYGLGGRDIFVEDIEEILTDKKARSSVSYVGVRK